MGETDGGDTGKEGDGQGCGSCLSTAVRAAELRWCLQVCGLLLLPWVSLQDRPHVLGGVGAGQSPRDTLPLSKARGVDSGRGPSALSVGQLRVSRCGGSEDASRELIGPYTDPPNQDLQPRPRWPATPEPLCYPIGE